ncbi:AAA family ATPase [Sulfurimonas paralvinellae]|uniref:ATP-binding protein n=1 Tax=Sulfurimonas paralvinellae TaxID=317658 RepID=A0A7M1BAW9_9BACT|nr:ATP-binding protein [Sulfurimonas paralvinellae]QOP46805.1 ATP-binding protein [Sulfurimonas paralvinellae]
MLFPYGKVVTNESFYDRHEIRNTIHQLLKGTQSFTLKAPRRYGKTSLIKQTLLDINQEYFYVDFRKIPRLELFNTQLMEYIYSQMGLRGAIKQIQENIITFLKKHRSTVKVDVTLFEASVELFASDKNEEDKLIMILELLGKLSKELHHPLYIVFDEFQDAVNMSNEIDIYEVMRAEIQHHENICYIFAGSNTTMMTTIFETKSAPFYNFSRKITLAPFDKDELSKEVSQAFKSRRIIFENDVLLDHLIDRCGGHPANTMLVLQMIEFKMLEEDIKTITKAIIDQCYQAAQEEMHDLVMEYLKEIRMKEHLHDVLFRMANHQKQVLDSSSLQQKRKYLVDMGHLRHLRRGEYEIIDNFLRDELINENLQIT